MRAWSRLVWSVAALAAGVCSSAASAQHDFGLIDASIYVPGATSNEVRDINAAGDIVGVFLDAGGKSKAFLLVGNVFTLLDIRDANGVPATQSFGNGINNWGQVVGRWDDSAGVSHGFLWKDGVTTVIDIPGAKATRLQAIHDNGTITGVYFDENGIGHGCLTNSAGELLMTIDYPDPGCTNTAPKGINDAGDIVGDFTVSGVGRGFLLRGGVFTPLDYPGGFPAPANHIDSAGTIAGAYFHTPTTTWHGYIRTADDVWSTIDVPGANPASTVSGFNGAGVLVGNCDINGRRYGYKTIDPYFHVVDDGTKDQVFKHDADAFGGVGRPLAGTNVSSRGLATNPAGTRHWVLNADRRVNVYDAAFGLVGSWTAGGLGSTPLVEGVATNGTDVWVVDAKSDKVFRYAGGAGHTSGDNAATSSFKLRTGNNNPKDLATDGVHLYVVDDAAADRVYKYTLAGAFVASFTLSTSGASSPIGLTLDPNNPGDLWVVDKGTRRAYRYVGGANAANGSSQAATESFALGPQNTNPQGLAIRPFN